MASDPGAFKGTERFAVISRLGRGGMGSVYHVADRERGTRLALKAVGKVTGDPLLRFKQEFRSLQEIAHPNLVTLGELFEHHGEWFFTMELVEGTDFLQFVRPGAAAASESAPTGVDDGSESPTLASPSLVAPKGSPLEAFRLADPRIGFDEIALRHALAQLVLAVSALHASGHIHRDIKPSNIVVERGGRVVLIDFGLVMGIAEGGAVTGQIMGTIDYMAPEQASGGAIGPAADWYSVGVTLFEALTGRLPIEDRPGRVLLRKQTEAAPSVRSLVPKAPSDLDALCGALLQIDPADRLSAAEILARLQLSRTEALSLSRTSSGGHEEFVGRRDELDRLHRAFESSGGTEQALVVVSGESGIGKSSLLNRFLSAVAARHEDVLILRGRCFEQETVPFKAFDGMMDQLGRWLGARSEAEQAPLLPRYPGLLGVVFPVLRRVPAIADGAAPQSPDPLEQRRLVMAALRELFDHIAARSRLVIAIDDVQWSDEESRRLFSELTRPPSPPPALLLLLERASPGERPRAAPLADWQREPTVISLGPLSDDESAELIARHLGERRALDPRQREALIAQARGHPIFLETLMRQGDQGGGGASHLDLGQALRAQIDALDHEARAVLEILALAGFPLARSVAAEAAGISRETLLVRLRHLRVQRLIRSAEASEAGAIEPYHAKIGEAALGPLDERQRRDHHRGLARALEQHEAPAEQVAQHHLGAGSLEQATAHTLRAARHAMQIFAFGRAAHLFRRAIDLGAIGQAEVPRISLELGHALANVGKGAEAAAAYRAALEGASPALVIDLKRRIAEQLLTSGLYDEGRAAGDDVLGHLGLEAPASPGAALRQLGWLRVRLWLRGLEHTERSVDEVTATDLARIDACWSLARGFAGHDVILGQVFQTRALLFALAAGEPLRVAKALCFEYLSRAIDGPTALTRDRALLERAARIGEQADSAVVRASVAFAEGMGAHTGTCDFARSAPLFEVASRILQQECLDVAWERSLCDEQRLIAYFWLGRWRDLAAAVPGLCQHADDVGNPYWVNRFSGGYLSFAAEIRGDVKEARRLIERGAAALPARPSAVQRFGQMWCATRLDLYEGNWTAALERIEGFESDLVASLILKVPLVMLVHELDRARVYLLAARHERRRQGRFLQLVRRAARRLTRSHVVFGGALGAVLEGAAAIAEGALEVGLPLLARGQAQLSDRGICAIAAAIQRGRGALEGGENGRRLRAEGDRWFAENGVVDPESMGRMLLPL